LRLSLPAGSCALVKGPARVRVHRGSGHVFGYPLSEGSRLVVKKHRQYPLEAITDMEIEVVGGEASVAGGRVGTGPWSVVVEEVLKDPGQAVVVAGPIGSGRSSLSIYLANTFLSRRGGKVGIVDVDPAHGDLAPPGFIGAATFDRPVLDLEEEKPLMRYFVGSLSPYGLEGQLERGLSELLSRCAGEGAGFVVISFHSCIWGERAAECIARAASSSEASHVVLIGSRAADALRRKGFDVHVVEAMGSGLGEPGPAARERRYQRELYMRSDKLKYLSLSPLLCRDGPIRLSTSNFVAPEAVSRLGPAVDLLEDMGFSREGVRWAYVLRSGKRELSVIFKVGEKGVYATRSLVEGERAVSVYVMGRGVGLLSGVMAYGSWHMAIWEDFDIPNYKMVFACPRGLPEKGIGMIRVGLVVLSTAGRELGVVRAFPRGPVVG